MLVIYRCYFDLPGSPAGIEPTCVKKENFIARMVCCHVLRRVVHESNSINSHAIVQAIACAKYVWHQPCGETTLGAQLRENTGWVQAAPRPLSGWASAPTRVAAPACSPPPQARSWPRSTCAVRVDLPWSLDPSRLHAGQFSNGYIETNCGYRYCTERENAPNASMTREVSRNRGAGHSLGTGM